MTIIFVRERRKLAARNSSELPQKLILITQPGIGRRRTHRLDLCSSENLPLKWLNERLGLVDGVNDPIMTMDAAPFPSSPPSPFLDRQLTLFEAVCISRVLVA